MMDDTNHAPMSTEKSVQSAGDPATPHNGFEMMLEPSLYEDSRKMEAVLKKLTQFLQVCEPELLQTMENMGNFNKWAQVSWRL